MVTVSKDKVTCITGDLLEGCTTSSLSFLVDGGYVAPDIISFVQGAFCEGFIGKANLPTMVRIHDNSCCLPFSDVLEDLFNPLGVGLMANYCGIVNIACNHNDLRDLIEYNKDWVHGQAEKTTDVDLPISTPECTLLAGSSLPSTLCRILLPKSR